MTNKDDAYGPLPLVSSTQVLDRTDIVVKLQPPNFDKACRLAYREAAQRFELDQDGYAPKVPGPYRTGCWLEVHSSGYVGTEHENVYRFIALVVCHNEDGN